MVGWWGGSPPVCRGQRVRAFEKPFTGRGRSKSNDAPFCATDPVVDVHELMNVR